MSLATFKKKSTNKYSTVTKRSGKPPGGHWLNQGPFGGPETTNSVIFMNGVRYIGPEGFSINGGTRFIPVAKEMKFSNQGTRYRGIHPIGYGGHYGQYYHAEPLLNAGLAKIDILGNQYKYIKPSTLSTKGMIDKRWKWIQNGQYPNYWVQPVYTGNMVESASQGNYLQQLSAANVCVVDVNNDKKYVGYIKKCGPFDCSTTPARGYKMVVAAANAPYTKFLRNSQDSSQYTLQVQKKCANPKPWQKPFPYAVQTGTGILTGGTSVNNVGSGCNTSDIYVSPPEWYLRSPSGIN